MSEGEHQAPSPLHFDQPLHSDPWAPLSDGPDISHSTMLHGAEPHPVTHDHAQRHQNDGPTMKTFHDIINGASRL
jgi:hypothetical protein